MDRAAAGVVSLSDRPKSDKLSQERREPVKKAFLSLLGANQPSNSLIRKLFRVSLMANG